MATAQARHILVKTQEEADRLKSDIAAGADFGDVARKHSTCPSSRSGRDLGEFRPGQMAKEPCSRTDLTVGTGTAATAGRVVSVNYTGWLYDTSKPDNKGTQFDSNAGRGAFQFTLGFGQVIAGWDQGVAGMKIGGKRRLI